MKKTIVLFFTLLLFSRSVEVMALENNVVTTEVTEDEKILAENMEGQSEKIIGVAIVIKAEAGVRTRPLYSDKPSHWFGAGVDLPLYHPYKVYYNANWWYRVCKPGTNTYIGYILADDVIIR